MPAKAVDGAAAHAEQEELPVRILLFVPSESGQIIVGDLVVAGGDIHNQKATVVAMFDLGADVPLPLWGSMLTRICGTMWSQL